MKAQIAPYAPSFPEWIRRTANILNPMLNPDRIQTDTSLYNKGTGTTWPYQDLTYEKVEHGTSTNPIATNAGAANFFTPFWRGAYLNAGHIGGLQTGIFVGQIRGAPDASSTNLNYTPVQSLMSATTNLGGTGLTLGTAKGALFGSSFCAVAYAGATNLLNLTGCEYNTEVASTASVAIKTGNQIVQLPQDAVSGSLVDAGLAFSNQGGAVNWNQVICLSHTQNGQHSVKTSGTLIGTLNNPSCATGIDFNGVTFSGNAYQSSGAAIDGSGNGLLNTLKVPELTAASVATPAAGYQTLFIDTADHKLKRKDSTGTVTIIA